MPVAAAAGMAAALAPAYPVAWIVGAVASVAAVAALRRPRLLLVLALGALVAYLPDAATAGTPVPGVDLVLLAPAAVLVARRLLGVDRVTVPGEAAAFLALLIATTTSALMAAEPAIALGAIRQTAEYACLVVAESPR